MEPNTEVLALQDDGTVRCAVVVQVEEDHCLVRYFDGEYEQYETERLRAISSLRAAVPAEIDVMVIAVDFGAPKVPDYTNRADLN